MQGTGILPDGLIPATEADTCLTEGQQSPVKSHLLEGGDGGLIKVALPVEGGRAVVGQHLARELGLDGLCKLPGLRQVRGGRLHPQQVSEGRVCQATCNGSLQFPAYGSDPVRLGTSDIQLAFGSPTHACAHLDGGRLAASSHVLSLAFACTS